MSIRNKLVKDIVIYFMEINFFTFTDEEVKEGIKECYYMLDNCKEKILEILYNEYDNTEDNEVLELIYRVKAY